MVAAESAALPVAASLLATGFAVAVLGNAYSTLLGPGARPLTASPALAVFAIAHLVIGLGFFVAGLVAMGGALKKEPDKRLWFGGLLASVALAAVVILQTLSIWMPRHLA
jgi:hypothetical protein